MNCREKPFQLDNDWRLCKYDKEKGLKIPINRDAHNEEGSKDIYIGGGIGQKEWLEPRDIFNTPDLGEMKALGEARKPI